MKQGRKLEIKNIKAKVTSLSQKVEQEMRKINPEDSTKRKHRKPLERKLNY